MLKKYFQSKIINGKLKTNNPEIISVLYKINLKTTVYLERRKELLKRLKRGDML
jgi:hypothetical protein